MSTLIINLESLSFSSILASEIFKKYKALNCTPAQDDFFYSSAQILVEYILDLIYYLPIKRKDKNLCMVLCLTNSLIFTDLLEVQAKYQLPVPYELIASLLEGNIHTRGSTFAVAYDAVSQYISPDRQEVIGLTSAQVVDYEAQIKMMIES